MFRRTQSNPLHRRAFIRGGSLFLLSAGAKLSYASETKKPAVRVGLITDLHYADKPSANNRHYRETVGKLEEAANWFEEQKPHFVVELGDLIDAAESVEDELSYLAHINKTIRGISCPKHFVLGNHCVDTLTKDEFLRGVEQKSSYYSFDHGQHHFIVLDACFRSDGKPYGRKNSHWTDANVPQAELEWLKEDLTSSGRPTVVFAHQRLDIADRHSVNNAADVRKVFEASGKVQAVFQGHSHGNDYQHIGGIHYCTLVAMVEGSGKEHNGYSVLDVAADGTLCLRGSRRQRSYQWK